MGNQQIVDSILKAVKSEVEQFISEESQITSSFEYEGRVLEIARKFASELVNKSKGDLPKSRNLKKK